MRIIRTKYYIMTRKRKDSWGTWIDCPEVSIVTGYKARNERPYITDQFDPTLTDGTPLYELHDGHIRGHRPTTTNVKRVIEFLDNNPFSEVSVLS